MGKKESIIISDEHKSAIIASTILFMVIIAVKWFVIGYCLGKRGCGE